MHAHIFLPKSISPIASPPISFTNAYDITHSKYVTVESHVFQSISPLV